MDRRVEALADRRHGHDPKALECGLELADHELQAADEKLLGARLAGMVDRPAEVVENGEQRDRRILALIGARVSELLRLAPLEILEVRGEAEIASVALVRLLGGAVQRLRLRRRARVREVASVRRHAFTMPTLNSKHARRPGRLAERRSEPGVRPAHRPCG